jgi:hypothetical protein
VFFGRYGEFLIDFSILTKFCDTITGNLCDANREKNRQNRELAGIAAELIKPKPSDQQLRLDVSLEIGGSRAVSVSRLTGLLQKDQRVGCGWTWDKARITSTSTARRVVRT